MDDYEKYYQSMNTQYGQYGQGDEYEQHRKKRGGFGRVFGFISVALVFLVIGMLLAGVIQSVNNPWYRSDIILPEMQEMFPRQSNVTPNPTPAPSPTPKPVALNRPMVELDGVAPQLPVTGNPIPDMIEDVGESVVGILNYTEDIRDSKKTYSEDAKGNAEKKEDRIQSMGTGFIISSSGYIVTNAHVVQDAYELAVELIDGSEITAEIIGVDEISDIAVLKVNRAGLKALKFGDSGAIRVGDYAVAVGNPLGRGLEGTVTLGIISARSRAIAIDGVSNLYIQTDAAINLGNSGGPLLNMKGEVIGMNTAKTINAGIDEYGMAISAEGLGFALPADTVRVIIERLITAGYVQRSAMGVTIRAMTRAELDELGLSNGISVYSVSNGGPAEKAGVKSGDIILYCDGKSYTEQAELVEYISMNPLGSNIELVVWREGQSITLKVTLADKDYINYEELLEVYAEETE